MLGSGVPRRRSRYYEPMVFFGCLVAMCCLYWLFISRYCTAAPVVTNRTSSAGLPSGQMQLVPASLTEHRGDTSADVGTKDAKAPVSSRREVALPSGEDDLAADFYLSQITAFYQNVIGWLFGLIGAILALNYLYLRASSRAQAEEMAAQALEHAGFGAQLDKKIELEVGKKWTDAGKANIEADIEEMKERIEFLEKSVTVSSYEGLREPEENATRKEEQDGNNQK